MGSYTSAEKKPHSGLTDCSAWRSEIAALRTKVSKRARCALIIMAVGDADLGQDAVQMSATSGTMTAPTGACMNGPVEDPDWD